MLPEYVTHWVQTHALLTVTTTTKLMGFKCVVESGSGVRRTICVTIYSKFAGFTMTAKVNFLSFRSLSNK